MNFLLKTILIIFLIFLTVPASPSAAKEGSEPTSVGVLLPLTGEYASWGEGIRRSIELFEAENPSQFKFEFQDEGNCEAQKSLSGYKKIRLRNVKIFIVGCLAGTKAILSHAKENDAILVSTGLLEDNMFDQGTNLINLATQLSTESRYLAERIFSRGLKRTAIVHWEDHFSNEFADSLHRELIQRGATVAQQIAVDPKENDYRAMLLKIKKSNPDSIAFNVGQNQQSIMLKQIKELGLQIPIFTNYLFENKNALVFASLATDVEYTYPLNSAESSKAKLDFDDKFTTRFGSDAKATPNSYFIYDGLQILKTALGKCRSDDTYCLGLQYKNTTHYLGISGDIAFCPNGSNDRPYGIKKISSNQFQWVNAKAKKQITNQSCGVLTHPQT